MDENDKILKELISSKANYDVPYSFSDKIISKIQQERERRAVIAENLQIAIVFIVAAAILIFSLYYLNTNFFHLKLEQFKLTGYDSDFIGNLLLKVKSVYLNKGAITWYIITINATFLIVLQHFIRSRYFRNLK